MKARLPKAITTAHLIRTDFDAEIVRRYNAHEAMLQALKSFTDTMRGDGPVDFLKLVELLPEADSAIESAEVKP